MQPPTTFETERLLLRLPILDDAETIFKLYAQDVEVTRYLTWKPHSELGQTRAHVERCIANWEQGSRFAWVIALKDLSGFQKPDRSTIPLLVGMIEMRINRFEAVLGYVLARPFWGQGIMTEAVRTLIGWALAQPEIYRVSATCDWENRASARVMEKAGMQREGLRRRGVLHPNISDAPRDCWLYAKTK